MNEPTDAELDALWDENDLGPEAEVHRRFARAVLAKWGTPPAVAGEPVARQYQSGDGLWHNFIDARHEKNTIDSGEWPIRALYATPQPTRAQAGAVPLTDGQAKEVLWTEHLRWMQAAGLDTDGMRPTGEWLDHWLTYVRAIERAHGIGIKGGQHGADT